MPPPILDIEPGTEIGSLRVIRSVRTDKGLRGQLCECTICGKRVVRSNSYLSQAGLSQGYNLSCGCSRESRKPRHIWRDMFLWLVLNMEGHEQTGEYSYNSPIWNDSNCNVNIQNQLLALRDQVDSEYKKSYSKQQALRMLQTAKFWINQL